MFNIIKCRGVLYREMRKRIEYISSVSYFLFVIPIMIVSFFYQPESTVGRICGALILWYIVSLIVLKRIDYENGNIGKIMTLPVFLSLKLSIYIFKFFLIKKYPEISEEHYDRWKKLKRIQNKIKRK